MPFAKFVQISHYISIDCSNFTQNSITLSKAVDDKAKSTLVTGAMQILANEYHKPVRHLISSHKNEPSSHLFRSIIACLLWMLLLWDLVEKRVMLPLLMSVALDLAPKKQTWKSLRYEKPCACGVSWVFFCIGSQ